MTRRRAGWGAFGCAALFLLLAVLAISGATSGTDRFIEAHVHTWVVTHPPWPRVAQIAGQISQPAILRILALLVALALFTGHRPQAGAWLLATMALSGVLGILLKLVFVRARPSWADPIQVIGGYSLPSGHALNSAAAAGCVIALLAPAQGQTRRARSQVLAARACAVLFALVAGIDRVVLGVHYASDVVAGWAAGAGVVLLTWALAGPSMRPPVPRSPQHPEKGL